MTIKIPKISITSAYEAEYRLLNEPEKYEYLLSIGAPVPSDPPPDGFEEFTGEKIRIEFDDVSYPTQAVLNAGYVPPTLDDAKKIIKFTKDIDHPILIHCAAGISRSSASALILIAQKFGPGKEDESIHYLITLEDKDPEIFPNELLVSHADYLLERDGDLIMAYKKVFF